MDSETVQATAAIGILLVAHLSLFMLIIRWQIGLLREDTNRIREDMNRIHRELREDMERQSQELWNRIVTHHHAGDGRAFFPVAPGDDNE